MNYKKIYDDLYNRGYNKNTEKKNPTNLIAYLKNIKPSLTIIDVGAGTGYLVDTINKETIHLAIGLEISPVAVEKSKHRLEKTNAAFFKVYLGSILDMPFPNNFADMCISCDVLEHLHPTHVLRAASELHRVAPKQLHQICTRLDTLPWKKLTPLKNLHLSVFPIHQWASFLDCHTLDNQTITNLPKNELIPN